MSDETKLPEWWTEGMTSEVLRVWRVCGSMKAAIAEVLRIESEHRNDRGAIDVATVLNQHANRIAELEHVATKVEAHAEAIAELEMKVTA